MCETLIGFSAYSGEKAELFHSLNGDNSSAFLCYEMIVLILYKISGTM